ncbi:hypothetical protein [Bacillus weihaiensis]|uniref:hypothetical protein n=1 Tax=Bacillus weihaiensis TaxID=1547283 RepID=UPI0023541783|nr:hypothetical protein [Bacillus weihaiensis]
MLKRISLLFIISFLLSLNFNKVSAEDSFILRKILTDISWTKSEEGTIINLDYIEIKKIGDQETTSGTNSYFIHATDLKYEKLNEKKVDKYLEESGSSSFVYNEDIVYGINLDIYADVHNESITREELETLTNEAIKEVNRYYEQKEEILSGNVTLKQEQQEIKDGHNSIYLWILSIIFALFGISILMNILKRRNK